MKIKMPGILTAGALLGTLLSTANVAQERTRGFGFDGVAHMRADGQVSEAEFVDARLQNVDAGFERLDTDDNGLVSLDEFTNRGRGDRRGRGLRDRNDADRADRRARPDAAEIDRTALTVCVRETVADFAPRAAVSLEDAFNVIDSSGDGQLSLAEFSAAQEARTLEQFDRIDGDGNGFVTAAEITARGEAQWNLRQQVVQACVREQRAAVN
jgi:Ca2+-binding EF-hand superfamily protein